MAKRIKIPLLRVIIYCVLVSIIGIGGYIYFVQKTGEIKEKVLEELSLIADFKTEQIVNWRNERFSDALSIFNNVPLSHSVKQYLEGESSVFSEVKQDIGAWMVSFQESLQYKNVLLFDASGAIRIALDEKNKEVCAYTQSLIEDAIRENKIVISNLYRCPSSSRVSSS